MIPPELATLGNPSELCIWTHNNCYRVDWGFDNTTFCLQTLVETWSNLRLITVHGNSGLFKPIGSPENFIEIEPCRKPINVSI